MNIILFQYFKSKIISRNYLLEIITIEIIFHPLEIIPVVINVAHQLYEFTFRIYHEITCKIALFISIIRTN